MAIINQSKISSTMANTTKINIGLIWDAALMTWTVATFTWDSTVSLIGNSAKAFGGFLWSASSLPWQLPTPWLDVGSITNQARPT